MKIRAFLICAAIAAFVCVTPHCEAQAKDKDIELDVSGIKAKTKEAGRVIKSGAKDVGRGVKSTVKDGKLKKSAKEAGKATKEALKETGRAIKKEIPVEVEKK